MYFLRLVLDLAPVLMSAEVEAEAAAATIGAPVVFVLIILMEPLIDNIILVNGGSESIIKDKIYLTPTGVPSLIKDLGDITVSKRLKNKIESTIKVKKNNESSNTDSEPDVSNDEDGNTGSNTGSNNDNNDEGGKTGSNNDKKEKLKGLIAFFTGDYTEHLWILLFLKSDQDEYLKRMQNLIQMESNCNLKNEGYKFSIKDAYTYVRTDIDYDLNSLFSFDGLSNGQGGPFQLHMTRYAGY